MKTMQVSKLFFGPDPEIDILLLARFWSKTCGNYLSVTKSLKGFNSQINLGKFVILGGKSVKITSEFWLIYRTIYGKSIHN